MFLQINIKEGKIISGKEKLGEVISKCPNGIYTIRMNYTSRPKSILECIKHYFFICSLISNEGETGYKSKELHDIFKQNVLPKIPNLHMYVDHPENFMDYNTPIPTVRFTTKMLNLEGWYVFLEGVKQYSKENLNFLL